MDSLRISSVRRTHGRAILTLTSGESIVMPRAMLKERPYRSGMPFDRAQFDAFLTERSASYALQKAVTLLASRDRTEKEIVDALRQNAYPEPTIARVMARLQQEGYLDDAAFAAHWTAARTARGWGARRIRQELCAKGVEREQIDRALSSADADSMAESALKVARKAAKGRDMSSPTERQKVIAALVRRGFDFSIARKALEIIEEEA